MSSPVLSTDIVSPRDRRDGVSSGLQGPVVRYFRTKKPLLLFSLWRGQVGPTVKTTVTSCGEDRPSPSRVSKDWIYLSRHGSYLDRRFSKSDKLVV